MAKIKRDIKKQPLLNRLANAHAIATACTGNSNASALTTQLAAFATATATLQTAVNNAQAAQDAAQSLVAAQAAVADAWNTAFDTLADAAATATNGDAVKIESLGMQPYTTGNAPAVGIPAQVLNLSATTGDFEGTVDLAWDKVPSGSGTAGARSYEIQVTTTPADSTTYHHAATALKSSATASGLASGTKYWFRVAAIGSAGQGPWSDPAAKMAG